MLCREITRYIRILKGTGGEDPVRTLLQHCGGGWLGGSGGGDAVKRTNEKCHRRSLVWPGSHEGGTRVKTRAHLGNQADGGAIRERRDPGRTVVEWG